MILSAGVVRFPAPGGHLEGLEEAGTKQWAYIERFLEVLAEPKELLGVSLQAGDILVTGIARGTGAGASGPDCRTASCGGGRNWSKQV